MAMRDDREPISRKQPERRAAEMRTLRDSLFVAAFFSGVVLINGILAILLIEFFRSIGWWEVQPATGGEGAAALSRFLARRGLTPEPGPQESWADPGVAEPGTRGYQFELDAAFLWAP
jgi:hypothetical protein